MVERWELHLSLLLQDSVWECENDSKKVENVFKTQVLDLKNSLAVNLLNTALSNGWDQKFALRLRNINQDGIDHINFQLITIHFQLITTGPLRMTVFFVPKPEKTQCIADSYERFVCPITVFRIFRSRSHKRRDTGVLSHYFGSCKARPCWTTQCYGAASVLRKCRKLKAPFLFFSSFCRCFIAFFRIIKLYVIAPCK